MRNAPPEVTAWNNTHTPCTQGVSKQGKPRGNAADPLWSVCRSNEIQIKLPGLIWPSGQSIWPWINEWV